MSRDYDYMTLSYLATHPDSDGDGDEQDYTKLTKQQVVTSNTSRYKRQQRYREKQRKYEKQLETTVKRLRMDVDQLLIENRAQKARVYDHKLTPPCQSKTMKMADVVIDMRECMKAFESGEQANQMRFLDSAMRSDVQNGDHVGRRSILEQWVYFADFAAVLEECEFSVDIFEQDIKVGRVSAMLVIRLTHRSLATIFPTLTSTRLRDRLLQNSEVRLPMTVFLQFDEQGKVNRYDSTIDFVTALYSVLKDYRDVASVLESVSIHATGQIRGDLPPAETCRQKIICCDHQHDRSGLESNSGRSISRLNKLSVTFLLSSDGGDTDVRNSNFSQV